MMLLLAVVESLVQLLEALLVAFNRNRISMLKLFPGQVIEKILVMLVEIT